MPTVDGIWSNDSSHNHHTLKQAPLAFGGWQLAGHAAREAG
jgi:hypothetical protein